MKLCDYEGAKQDFLEVLHLSPNDKLIPLELAKLKTVMLDAHQKEQKLYKAMFNASSEPM